MRVGGVSLCGNVSRLCKQPVTHHIAMSLTLGCKLEEMPNPSSLLTRKTFSGLPGLLGAWLLRVPNGAAETHDLFSATVTRLELEVICGRKPLPTSPCDLLLTVDHLHKL